MKYRPSLTFIILVCAAFASFFLLVGSHEYNKITTERKVLGEILTNHRQTEHFDIYSNLDSNSMDYYEHFFEGFYDRIDREYFEIRLEKPLRVFLFKDTDSYTWYAKRVGARTPYGFYMGPHENTIVANRYSGLGTVTHELVHHFIAMSFVERPAKWAEEGITTFFEKFMGYIDNEGKLHISFGYFSNWRFPLTKMRVSRLDLYKLIEAERPNQCAARSFMVFLNKKGYFKDFVRQLSKAENDPDSAQTLRKVCRKTVTELGLEWVDWVEHQQIEDKDVSLVPQAFVLTEHQWQKWWAENQDRIYWSEEEQIYKVRK